MLQATLLVVEGGRHDVAGVLLRSLFEAWIYGQYGLLGGLVAAIATSSQMRTPGLTPDREAGVLGVHFEEPISLSIFTLTTGSPMFILLCRGGSGEKPDQPLYPTAKAPYPYPDRAHAQRDESRAREHIAVGH